MDTSAAGAAPDSAIPIGPAPFSPEQMSTLRGLFSRSPYYCDDNAFLRVTVSCSLANVVVTVNWRKSNLDGTTTPGTESLAGRSDGASTFHDALLGEGLLYNVTAFASQGTPAIGQCFVQVQLMTGNNLNPTVLGTLVAAYVTGLQALGWPGSPVQSSLDGPGFTRTVVIGSPGVGLEMLIQVPLNFVRRIVSLAGQLTTSGVAGNRLPILVNAPGGPFTLLSPGGGICGPGTTTNYCWGAGLPSAAPGGLNQTVAGIPVDYRLGPLGSVQTQTVLFDAGDHWDNAAMKVQEWLMAQG